MPTQMYTLLQSSYIFMTVLKHSGLGKEYYLEYTGLVVFLLHLNTATCFDIL